ncbi:MAG: hypothetical protein ACXABO_13670 [Promethearchaeota archaeon]|jgi:uncharacterized protein YdeI (BOF family)
MSNKYAARRIIKDIINSDERIQITGYIKNRLDNENIILEDKTGEVTVKINKIENFKFKENDLINIIGDLEITSNGEKTLVAEIIQDMNKLNFEYFQKLYDLKKEYIE